MLGNFSGSWMAAFTTERLSQMAGFALDGAWPMPMRRDVSAFEPSVGRAATATARSIPVIAEEDDEAVLPRLSSSTPKQPVLSQEFFRSALIRERKRADRFEGVFAVLTIEGVGGAATVPMLQTAADAIAGSTRDTDVVGWLDEGVTLAILLPDMVGPSKEAAAAIHNRITRQLGSHVGLKLMSQLELRLHVHAGLGTGHSTQTIAADPLVAQIQSAKRRATVSDAMKRALDAAVSFSLLVLFSPVFLFLAALVKLTSPGPVLFKQSRIGEMAKPFMMLKFRSMQAAAPSALHQQFVTDFIKSGGQNGDSKFFKIRRDPRITPIGHLLRKTSLDELPQLWNVLRGDMSLVGPRPPLQYELEQYRSWHWRRVLEAKPGMTGLWQVEGRSRTTFDEMVRLDLRYARKRSFITDLRILLATPKAVVIGKGAC
jgi:lipopolysaccharide/colanic/teichoic acid biosynthesis glycosyltransferase